MKELDNAWVFLLDKKTFLKGSVELNESGMAINFCLREDSPVKEGDLIAVEDVVVLYDVTKEGKIGKN